jgi:hypothetical protein
MDVDETDVPPSPLATADIRAVKVSRVGKFLLGKATGQAQLPQAKPKEQSRIGS